MSTDPRYHPRISKPAPPAQIILPVIVCVLLIWAVQFRGSRIRTCPTVRLSGIPWAEICPSKGIEFEWSVQHQDGNAIVPICAVSLFMHKVTAHIPHLLNGCIWWPRLLILTRARIFGGLCESRYKHVAVERRSRGWMMEVLQKWPFFLVWR